MKLQKRAVLYFWSKIGAQEEFLNQRKVFEDYLSKLKAKAFMENLKLTPKESMIAERILKEICTRLSFLCNVGLDYLTLARSAVTLSGGEAQRIRLATQIGAGTNPA